jgi:hypothetical protein
MVNDRRGAVVQPFQREEYPSNQADRNAQLFCDLIAYSTVALPGISAKYNASELLRHPLKLFCPLVNVPSICRQTTKWPSLIYILENLSS